MSVLQAEAPPSLPIGTISPSVEPSENPPEAIPPIEQRMGPGKFPGIWKPVRSGFWAIHVAFGSACLILVLAILAAIPGLNILTLGYLIDPQRRVANSGRLRDGFPLMTLAPRAFGSFAPSRQLVNTAFHSITSSSTSKKHSFSACCRNSFIGIGCI